MDLIGDFEDSGWTVINGALASTATSGYLEASPAARAIAAAELIAAALGLPSKRLPDVGLDTGTPSLPELLRMRDSAVQALRRIRLASELRSLWEESGQLSDWELTVGEVVSRLQRQPGRRKLTKRSRVRLIEGSCFAIPLPSGGFALGLLTQLLAGKLPFGYFFGPRRPTPPQQEELARLNPSDAILRVKFGDTEIQNGRWHNLGQVEPWRADSWPTPPHTSGEAGRGLVWRMEYPRDARKSDSVRLERVSAKDAEGLGSDRVMGALAVEKELDRQL
jgi:hypothetical protein